MEELFGYLWRIKWHILCFYVKTVEKLYLMPSRGKHEAARCALFLKKRKNNEE